MDASKSSFYQHLLSLTKTEIDDIRILFDCDVKKVGRNEPCPCGSGKKYKDCHGKYQS